MRLALFDRSIHHADAEKVWTGLKEKLQDPMWSISDLSSLRDTIEETPLLFGVDNRDDSHRRIT